MPVRRRARARRGRRRLRRRDLRVACRPRPPGLAGRRRRDVGELIALGRAVKAALDGTEHARHPSDDRLSGVYGTIVFDDLGDSRDGPHQRNVTVFADGEVDRSPCGSGTCARAALLHADGRLAPGAVAHARLDRRHDVRRARSSNVAAEGRDAVVAEVARRGVPHRRAPLRARPARPARDRLRAAVSALPFLDAAAIAGAAAAEAVDALEAALRGGLDPDGRPAARQAVGADGRRDADHAVGRAAARRGQARHGRPGNADAGCRGSRASTCCSTRRRSRPAALVDGIALTNLRTAAVSALAVRHLPRPAPRRLVVFGTGPQALGARRGAAGGRAATRARRRRRRATARVEAFVSAAPRARARRPGGDADAVADADVVCCARPPASRCSTARSCAPTRRSSRSARTSPTPARSTSARRRATVVVESRASALREAGDVIAAIEAGALAADALVPLAALVRGEAAPAAGRPRLFKSTGMAWEDLVVAAAVHARAAADAARVSE